MTPSDVSYGAWIALRSNLSDLGSTSGLVVIMATSRGQQERSWQQQIYSLSLGEKGEERALSLPAGRVCSGGRGAGEDPRTQHPGGLNSEEWAAAPPAGSACWAHAGCSPMYRRLLPPSKALPLLQGPGVPQ